MAKSTKIEHVETLLWNRWLLIRIHCEDGTIGIGEGGVHGWHCPTKTMVEVMTPYLLGKNPHHIEHHYQFLYRSSHFMGAVVQGALSAIDIALWDIKGKRLGVPIHDLMGGRRARKSAAISTCAVTPSTSWCRTRWRKHGRGSRRYASRPGALTFTSTSRMLSGRRRPCNGLEQCERP